MLCGEEIIIFFFDFKKRECVKKTQKSKLSPKKVSRWNFLFFGFKKEIRGKNSPTKISRGKIRFFGFRRGCVSSFSKRVASNKSVVFGFLKLVT